MSEGLNLLERYSLIASVVTLLCGQVFFASSSNPTVYKILTIMVLAMLALNVLIILVVIYLEFHPDDVIKEFVATTASEVSLLLLLFYYFVVIIILLLLLLLFRWLFWRQCSRAVTQVQLEMTLKIKLKFRHKLWQK